MLIKSLEALLMKGTWYYAEGQRDRACVIYLEALEIANNALINNQIPAAAPGVWSQHEKPLAKTGVLSKDEFNYLNQSYIPRIKAWLCFVTKEKNVKVTELDGNASPIITEINFLITELFKIRNEYLHAAQLGITDNTLETRVIALINMMEQHRAYCLNNEKNYLLIIKLKAYLMLLAYAGLELPKRKEVHLSISRIYKILANEINSLNTGKVNISTACATENYSLVEQINRSALEHQCIYHQLNSVVCINEFKMSLDRRSKVMHYGTAVQQVEFAYQCMQMKYTDFCKTITLLAQMAAYLPVPDRILDGEVLCTNILNHLYSLDIILKSLKSRMETHFNLSTNASSADKKNLETVHFGIEVVSNKFNEITAALTKKPLVALADLFPRNYNVPQQAPFEHIAVVRVPLPSLLPVPRCEGQAELTQHNNPFKLMSEILYSKEFLKGCDENYYLGIISEDDLTFWLDYIGLPEHGLFIDPDKKIVDAPGVTTPLQLNSSTTAPVSKMVDCNKMPVACNAVTTNIKPAQRINCSLVAPLSSLPGSPKIPPASIVATSLMSALGSSGSHGTHVPISPKTPIATPVNSPMKRAYSQTLVQSCTAEVTDSPRKKADNKPTTGPLCSIRLSA